MAELCPKCKVIRNMRISNSERDIVDKEGKVLKIKTTSYQCEICNTFVRSEESEK